MGHEMGHVAARHSAARQSRATLGSAGSASSVSPATSWDSAGWCPAWRARAPSSPPELRPRSGAPGRPAGGALHGAGRLRSQRSGTRSRDPESPIDAYLSNLGQSRSEPSAMSQILSTHPRHEERVGELQAYIKTLSPADVHIEGDGRQPTLAAPDRVSPPPGARLRAIRQGAPGVQQAAQAAEQKQSSVVQQKVLSPSASSTPRSSSPTRPSSRRCRGTCSRCRGGRPTPGARSIAPFLSTPATSRRFARSRRSAASRSPGGPPPRIHRASRIRCAHGKRRDQASRRAARELEEAPVGSAGSPALS